MNPVKFPEANARFGPPPDLAESQCMTIPAYIGKVVAWQPSPEEVELISQGKPIFLSFLGGMPPHFPTLSFEEAIHPA